MIFFSKKWGLEKRKNDLIYQIFRDKKLRVPSNFCPRMGRVFFAFRAKKVFGHTL